MIQVLDEHLDSRESMAFPYTEATIQFKDVSTLFDVLLQFAQWFQGHTGPLPPFQMFILQFAQWSHHLYRLPFTEC